MKILEALTKNHTEKGTKIGLLTTAATTEKGLFME